MKFLNKLGQKFEGNLIFDERNFIRYFFIRYSII